MEYQKYHAILIFFNPKTQQTLMHRRDILAPINPNIWALFGGRSEPEDNNNPVTTLIREMKEELDVNLEAQTIKPLCDYLNPNLNTYRYVYYVDTDLSDQKIVLQEGAGYAWMDLQEVLEGRITDYTRRDLEYLIKFKGLDIPIKL